jgi:formamidopyrimidine-DNA glycosylase
MSGSYSIQSGSNSRGKHEHVIFVLCDGREIRYSDVRKFGRFNLTSLYDEFTSGLGPEPLDVSFTSRDFVERIRQYSAAIKPLLLNQSVIAGIGNIYADEALWSSGIHPCSKASILPRVRLARLYESIVRILGEAIDSRGTDFGDRVVYKGGYIPKIYGRSDQRCLKCGNKIKKIVVAQRGTHVCLKCQRQPTYVRQKV